MASSSTRTDFSLDSSVGSSVVVESVRFTKSFTQNPYALSEILLGSEFNARFGHEIVDHVNLRATNGDMYTVKTVRTPSGEINLLPDVSSFLMEWTVIKGDSLFFKYKGDGLFTVRIFDMYGNEVKDSKKNPSEDRVNVWIEEVDETAEDIPEWVRSDMFCYCDDYETEETDEDVRAYESSRAYRRRRRADPFKELKPSRNKKASSWFDKILKGV